MGDVMMYLQLISAVVMKDWHDVLNTCELQNWKEALAAVMTYAQPEEFSSLCGWSSSFMFVDEKPPVGLSALTLCSSTRFLDLLGDRLEAAEDPQLKSKAFLCYICAGNMEKLVSCWSRTQDRHCPHSLQVCMLDWI